jgi:hypothetical protein
MNIGRVRFNGAATWGVAARRRKVYCGPRVVTSRIGKKASAQALICDSELEGANKSAM